MALDPNGFLEHVRSCHASTGSSWLDLGDTQDMKKLRPGTSLLLGAASAAAIAYASWLRPRILSWGATRSELTGTYPGDELVPDPTGGATMATFLAASPEEVWPWLVQMGGGRAGWYSWDWVDNGGEPSADHIVPEWQTLEVGQLLQRPPKAPTNWWTVMTLVANRTLVLHASYDLLGKGFDTRTGPVPLASTEGTWGFYLRETQVGQTRLVVRTRNRSRPQLLQRPFALLVGEPVHFTMQARQFHNLRRRIGAEAWERKSPVPSSR